MSRIQTRFEQLQAAGRKALIPFITAGDPRPDVTLTLMHRLVEAGADIIELGVPFSDPMADGPVIQKAGERALAAGITLVGVLEIVRQFRTQDEATPVVLMGYFNPIEAMGVDLFAQRAASAGVDGVLTVDVPLEEASELLPALESAGIDPIFLLSPTSDEQRIARTGELGRGYLYYVSLKGVTGSATLDVDAVAEKLAMIRQHVSLPIGVGFGIRDATSAAMIARTADAVVVGSALVTLVAENLDDEQHMLHAVTGLLGSMRQAMDAAG